MGRIELENTTLRNSRITGGKYMGFTCTESRLILVRAGQRTREIIESRLRTLLTLVGLFR
jgi:hypothetical protein